MPRILIVDDNLGTLETVSTVLRQAGLEPVTAASGAEGLALARGGTCHVIWIDLQLQDMSGLDLLRELNRLGVSARKVIVTAFSTQDTAFTAGAAGADGYVDGPLFGDEILTVVRQALDGPHPVLRPIRGTIAPNASGIDPRIRQVLHEIESHLGRSWSDAELAELIGLSESWFRHVFHISTGQSPRDYRRERRLQVTARRLVTTHEDIKQIAHAVGYGPNSLREFRSAFRERFGMSPKAYRVKLWRGAVD